MLSAGRADCGRCIGVVPRPKGLGGVRGSGLAPRLVREAGWAPALAGGRFRRSLERRLDQFCWLSLVPSNPFRKSITRTALSRYAVALAIEILDP